MHNALPLLLDTDIGTDIDDAVALAYLLRQPRCELLGITTVTGEADKRAALADAVCRAAGRTDIPIHVGTQMPLLVAPAKLMPRSMPSSALGPTQTSARATPPLPFCAIPSVPAPMR